MRSLTLTLAAACLMTTALATGASAAPAMPAVPSLQAAPQLVQYYPWYGPYWYRPYYHHHHYHHRWYYDRWSSNDSGATRELNHQELQRLGVAP